MTWPLSQDFNEAVQNPATSFADPDLKAGTPATTPHGVPLPHSGNYADVYQFTGPGGRRWAVKCFTRPVAPDLEARYAAIARHLATANLPFTVGFDFLRQGIRVKGKYYPVVKMPWVDGAPINQFVREHLNRASPLEAMLSLWVRLCRRLRETGMAHGDLQHGNVLLVPSGDKHVELKLVDYDGMFVPALAGRPTGEAGHAAYQHPQRAAAGVYSADLDRFPHLVVATALRGLLVGGGPLWRKYDTGDNLLFTDKDFAAPGRSKLMRELWDTGDPFTVGLLAHLALACTKPLAQTPWLDQLMPEGRPPVLTPSQERQAAAVLGVTVAAAVPQPPPAPPPVQPPAPALTFDDAPRRRRPVAKGGGLIGATVLGGLLLIGVLVGVGLVILQSKEKPADATRTDPPPPTTKDDAAAKPGGDSPPVKVPGGSVPPPPRATPAVAAGTVPAARELWATPAPDDLAAGPARVKFSTDGRQLVVNEQGSHLVHALDTRDGSRQATFRGLPGGRAVPFAPLPGGKVALAGAEPVLVVWDPPTGKAERFPVPNPLPAVANVTAARDGRHVLLAGPGKAAVLDFDAPGREVLSRPTTDPPSALLADDGGWLLTAEPGGRKVAIEPLTPRGKPGWFAPSVGPVVVQAWNSPNHYVALRGLQGGRPGKDIHVWYTEAPFQEVKLLPGDYAPCPPKFSPDGGRLFAAAGSAVEAWDTRTWAKVAAATVRGADVADFALSPDGRRVAAVAADRTVRLFDFGDDFAVRPPDARPVVAAPAGVRTLREVWSAPFDVDAERDPRWVRFSPDGTRLVVPALQAAVTHTFDAATGGRLATRAESAARLVASFPLPGGKVLTYPADAPAARAWDAASGRDLESFTVPHDGRCQMLGLSPDGRHALLRRDRGDVAVLDTRSGKAVGLAAAPGPGVARLSPDGAAVLVTAGNQAALYASADGRRTTTFELPFARCQAAALSPDRRTAALMPAPTPDDPAPPLHVFDVATGKPVRTIPGPFARAGDGLRFSPDGRRFAAARLLGPTGEYAFEVRDAAAWAVVARAAEPVAGDAAFDFRPDGARVVVWSADRRLRAYDLPGDLFAAAPPPGPAEPPRPARKPVPDPDAAAKAAAFVRDAFKAEFDKKLPADRRRLAEKLVRDTDQTADAATRYAMLRAAGTIAAELADVPLAARAIDALDQDYDIDGPKEKDAVVEKVAAGTSQVPQLRAAAEAALELAEDAAGKDDYDRAVRLAGLAAAVLGKAGQPAPARDAETRQQQLKKLRDEFEPVRRAAEALKAKPSDPAAALAVGRHRAFAQRRWDEGLALLAVGSDPALRKLAGLDLKAATDTETTDVQRGDAWAKAAKDAPAADQAAYRDRAKVWYVRALSSQRGGLDVERAKANLAFTHGGREYRPGLVTELNTVPAVRAKRKAQVDLTIDFATRDLHKEFGPALRVVWTGVLVPPAAGRYKLIAETTDAVAVKVFAKPDQQTLIDMKAGAGANPEAAVVLPDRPVPVEVAYALIAGPRERAPNHTLVLKWVRPGAKAAEPIPPGVFFHARKDEPEKASAER